MTAVERLTAGRAEPARGPVGDGARARRLLWRTVLTATGGVRVVGELPPEPCVIVANHSSHADTAALLATIPAHRAPVVAAAADYWFGGRRRRWICRWLAGAFPVRRAGGGSADLAEAARVLAAGHDVIVFPEGTRSRDGRLGEFHSGAARLAAAAGAALVPVGIHGTRDLLPVHGRPGRSRVTVRIGAPSVDLTEAKSAVAELATPAGRHRTHHAQTGVDSVWRRRVATFAESRAGAIAVAAWSFAEALSWPLIPEFALAVVVVAAPRRAPRLALCAALGSMAGGAVTYLLAAHGIVAPAPLTTPRMHHVVSQQIAAEGPSALAHQTWSGIPFKVYGAAAGSAHIGLSGFLVHAATSRGLRIFGVGLVLGLFGILTRRWRRWYGVYLASFLIIFGSGLAGVVTYWSQP
jgi:1-acyl-sn-glycerol-3-phosphate acyltransferase